MPDDRMFHPRMLRSQKVGALSYFEKWVWEVMIFVADNYGVLPDKAALLIGSDDSLENSEGREPGCVRIAMDAVVRVGLFVPFEDNQGQKYVCDPNWQDFQKIQWPKATFHPVPPPEVLEQLSHRTIMAFKKSHPSFRKNSAVGVPVPHRLTARGLRLTANGSGSEEGSGEEPTAPAKKRGRNGHEPPWCAPEELVAFYNEQAPENWERCTTLSAARTKKLQEYLAQFPKREFWETVIVVQPLRSPFLLGRTQSQGRKPFKGSLDWLIQKGKHDQIENCLKVFEGKYTDDGDTHARPAAAQQPRAVQRASAAPRTPRYVPRQ